MIDEIVNNIVEIDLEHDNKDESSNNNKLLKNHKKGTEHKKINEDINTAEKHQWGKRTKVIQQKTTDKRYEKHNFAFGSNKVRPDLELEPEQKNKRKDDLKKKI